MNSAAISEVNGTGMHRWQALLALVTGILIIASAFAHALAGWPRIYPALVASSLPADLIGGLATGWYFGSVSMLAFGLITFLTGVSSLRSGTVSAIPLKLISLTFAAFGIFAFISQGYAPHFLIFIIMGLLVGISSLRIPAKTLSA
jgi:hypothetical protein